MNKLLLRILFSVFVFLYGCFMVLTGCLFPIPMLAVFSLFGLVSMPFVWLFNKTGANIKNMDPFLNQSKYLSVNHFLGATIFIWGAFAITGQYIKTGTVWTGESETNLSYS